VEVAGDEVLCWTIEETAGIQKTLETKTAQLGGELARMAWVTLKAFLLHDVQTSAVCNAMEMKMAGRHKSHLDLNVG
jgi:hypothetical protein